MKKLAISAAMFGALVAGAPALASEAADMVGTWAWEGFTIDVAECDQVLCATITDGPSHVGEEMFLTAPEAADEGGWTAEVMHPATGETYFSRFDVDGDTWSMEGCTEGGVCAQGDFIRQ